MHADLKREPRTKPEIPGEGVQSVTAQVWAEPPKVKRMGGIKNTTKKPLPLPSTLKATHGTLINITVIVTFIWGVADHVVLKLLQVLAGKPQCKSPSDPTLRTLPKNTGFQPEATSSRPGAHTGHTHSIGTRVHMRLGAGPSLEIRMQGL